MKQFTKSLLVMLTALFSFNFAFAETGTETEGGATGGGAKDTQVDGQSYYIASTFIAGKGSAQTGEMTSKGFKLRTNQDGGRVVFTVNENYTITSLSLTGASNYALVDGGSKDLSVTKVEVDGSEVTFAGGEAFKDKSGGVSCTLTITDVKAKESIAIYFDKGDSNGNQINASWVINWERPDATQPTITVSPAEVTLIPGATYQLSTKVDPNSFTTNWVSDLESVATVNEIGLVTAVAAGTAAVKNVWTDDATVYGAAQIYVAAFNPADYKVAKEYDFTSMGDVTLTIEETAAANIWNEGNNKVNGVFFCTNEGLSDIAVQAVVNNDKGWSITEAGLTLAGGAGRCAAIGNLKAGQIVELIYTGSAFYTGSKNDAIRKDDGAAKTALNQGVGRAIYQMDEDGFLGFEIEKGKAIEKIIIYEEDVPEPTPAYIANADFASLEGWTAVTSASFHDQGNGLIGTYQVRSEFAAATVDEKHLATEYCIGLEARWASSFASYTQETAELPAGEYMLLFDVENINANTKKNSYNNLFKVIVGETEFNDTFTEWMDGASAWTTHGIKFTIAENAKATISLGYGNFDGDANNLPLAQTPALYVSHLQLVDAATGEAILEQIEKEKEAAEQAKKEAELAANTAKVAGATLNAPVAAPFVVNGTFDDADLSKWKATGGFQNNTRKTTEDNGADIMNNALPWYENWTPSANAGANKMSQVIENIPNGVYKLSITAFANNVTEQNENIYVFANADKTFLTAKAANYEVYTKVDNNSLEVGLEQLEAVANWMGIDNVSLTYYGTECTAEEAYNSDHAEEIALKKALEELQAEITAAEALLADENKTNGKEDFQTAIATAKALLKSTDIEAIKAGIAPLKAAEQTFKKANYYINFAAGAYYIIDTESGKFMAAGHDWGTRAIINETGLDLTLTPNEETRTVTIDSRVSNGGDSHFLGSNLYMDAGAFGWALEYRGFGFYITDGSKYLNYDASDNLILSDQPREWIIVSAEGVKAERLEEMAEATEAAPKSATFLLQNPNFNRNDQRVSAWQVSEDCTNKNLNGGNNTNNCAESFHSTFTISQAIEGAPKGVYALTAQGFFRQDDDATEDAPVFFANENVANVPAKTGSEGNMSQASESFAKGAYTIDPIYFEIGEGGAITVGVKGTATHQWVIFDNFQLTYYGADANIENLKNAALIAELAALRTKAEAMKDQLEVESLKTALDEALAATADASGVEAINAAIATMKAAIEPAETSLSAKEKLAKMSELIAATNVYTAEAYEQYYNQWVVKYLDGSLTKEEEAALQNPFLVTDWHASITCDNFLLSAWDTNPDFQDAPYYINTWSVEGETDGSNFKVPFFEYWTDDANSLGERTLTATMNGIEAGDYDVTAWVRVRTKNEAGADAEAYGITLSANEGEATDVTKGETKIALNKNNNFYLQEFTAVGTVGEDGVLKIQFKVAADNNISWLSFKNVKFGKHITVNPDDPEITVPEGKINLIANGNLAGDDVTSFFAKGYPSTEIVGATIVAGAGKNNSRGIVVKAGDDTQNEGAQAWDSQFWIQLNQKLTSGTKVHVEFDYMASQAAKVSTQSHSTPGNYLHWAMIGDVNFTTEWQHFSTDITVDDAMAKGDNGNGGGDGLYSIAFNLQEEKSATDYYFDNFGVWAELPKPVEEWTDLIANGDMEGDDTQCFYVTEQGVGGPFVAITTAGIGKDGSKAVKVQSADSPAQDWDSQFFIRLPYQLPAGTKFKLSFDYKADKAGDFDTQAHAEPGQYIHWACAGSGSFTTEWQSYSFEGSVPAECDGSENKNEAGEVLFLKTFQTIAFNLAKNKVATEFIFDNIKFEIPADAAKTLNPAVNPVPYPVPVDLAQTLNVERYPGLGYGVTEATVDFTEAKAFLGVEEITTDMLSIVNPDNTTISDYATYDGWFNGEGAAETWASMNSGDADKKAGICVKFFQAIPEGTYTICDMNGADEIGKTYSVKWQLAANDKKVTYTINVTFVEKPVVTLTFADLTKKDEQTVALTSELGNCYEGLTADVDVAAILAKLEVTSLNDVTIYAVQSDGSLDDNYKLGTTDGWRNAAGDWQTWGADAYFYVKADFAKESAQIYEIGGMENKNTVEEVENPASYTATYAFVKNGSTDAVVLKVTLTYVVPTGIKAINADMAGKTIYNLRGQKVNKADKGLFIINGRKVVK